MPASPGVFPPFGIHVAQILDASEALLIISEIYIVGIFFFFQTYGLHVLLSLFSHHSQQSLTFQFPSVMEDISFIIYYEVSNTSGFF